MYSEKIGCLRIAVNKPESDECPVLINSAKELLDDLFKEIIDDMQMRMAGKEHDSPTLSDGERMEARRRIGKFLKTMETKVKAEDCLRFLDAHPESDLYLSD